MAITMAYVKACVKLERLLGKYAPMNTVIIPKR
jgi:hypothetical protein